MLIFILVTFRSSEEYYPLVRMQTRVVRRCCLFTDETGSGGGGVNLAADI